MRFSNVTAEWSPRAFIFYQDRFAVYVRGKLYRSSFLHGIRHYIGKRYADYEGIPR